MRFQMANNLQRTGKLDHATRNALLQGHES